VLERIVAGRDIHAAIEFSVKDRVSNRRSRRKCIAEQNLATVLFQHARSRPRKILGKKSRIVAHDQRRILLQREHVPRNPRRGSAHSAKRKVLGHHAAPTRCPEMNRFVRHKNVLYLGLQARRTQYAIPKSKFAAIPVARIKWLPDDGQTPRGRHLSFRKGSRAYRPRYRRRAPRRLRQYSAQSGPLDLSLEGKNRIRKRSVAADKNLTPQIPGTPGRRQTPAQLRGPRNYRVTHRRRIA